jgi:transcriptional regulator NrdR family protein
MHCPECGTPANKVGNKVTKSFIDTCESRIRQRLCICGHRWWTVEAELPPGSVQWVIADEDQATYSVPARKPGAQRISIS